MSKYLVTGAAGFIASRTVELLLEQGHEVVAIDNLNDYYDVRLKTYRLNRMARLAGADNKLSAQLDFINSSPSVYSGPEIFETGRLVFKCVDIENQEDLAELFRFNKFDAVVNLAARAGVRRSLEIPGEYVKTNVMGTLNLLDNMRDTGVPKLVLASTSSLYAGQPVPFIESLPVNNPMSPYSASKKAAELMAYSYHHLYKIDVSILRYFTVFGPAGRPDMAPFRFIKWISEGTSIRLFGDGLQSRDFTYIDDIARGTIAALRPLGYEIINLGGGHNPVTILQIITWLEDMLGKKAEIDYYPHHPADLKDTWADISKAKSLLGWEPGTQVKEGFANTVRWYMDPDEGGRAVWTV
jgi:UDP-glucuronate 4-epimerase